MHRAVLRSSLDEAACRCSPRWKAAAAAVESCGAPGAAKGTAKADETAAAAEETAGAAARAQAAENAKDAEEEVEEEGGDEGSGVVTTIGPADFIGGVSSAGRTGDGPSPWLVMYSGGRTQREAAHRRLTALWESGLLVANAAAVDCEAEEELCQQQLEPPLRGRPATHFSLRTRGGNCQLSCSTCCSNPPQGGTRG